MGEPVNAPALCVVVTTLGEEAAAEAMAKSLLEAHLAACVQIAPIRSLYHWNGAIESANEWRLDVKTRRDLASQTQAAIRAAHPYETPEILCFDIAASDPDYRDWACAQTRAPKTPVKP